MLLRDFHKIISLSYRCVRTQQHAQQQQQQEQQQLQQQEQQQHMDNIFNLSTKEKCQTVPRI